MPMPRDTLHALLSAAFPDGQVTLTDLAGDNDHWQAEIVSERFRGLSRIAQHQLVYAALKGAMDGPLHALALRTSAPP
jgi:phosphoribosylformylglycinamidine synthase